MYMYIYIHIIYMYTSLGNSSLLGPRRATHTQRSTVAHSGKVVFAFTRARYAWGEATHLTKVPCSY